MMNIEKRTFLTCLQKHTLSKEVFNSAAWKYDLTRQSNIGRTLANNKKRSKNDLFYDLKNWLCI